MRIFSVRLSAADRRGLELIAARMDARPCAAIRQLIRDGARALEAGTACADTPPADRRPEGRDNGQTNGE